MTGSTVLSLSASNLATLELSPPAAPDLDRIADPMDASERAYLAATEAVAKTSQHLAEIEHA